MFEELRQIIAQIDALRVSAKVGTKEHDVLRDTQATLLELKWELERENGPTLLEFQDA